MQWVAKIKCIFGLHQFIPIRGSLFQYRQKELYLENQDYKKESELIVSVLYCPICGKRIEININK